MVPIEVCVQLACIWEATARKAGNVHRSCDFADMTYLDFIVSAAAIAPVFQRASALGLGQTVLHAIEATRQVVNCNTNLGIVLLLAPLATGLKTTTVEDSRLVYRAIRLAHPGGLGEVETQDVAEEPTLPLRAVMALAADRDLIARQYVNDFADVRHQGVPALSSALTAGVPLEGAILACQLHWLAHYPDSHILRKRGVLVAEAVRRRAAEVLASGWQHGNGDRAQFLRFDAWLRSERLNPGTTADLVTASLYLAIRQELVVPGHPFDLSDMPGTITAAASTATSTGWS